MLISVVLQLIFDLLHLVQHLVDLIRVVLLHQFDERLLELVIGNSGAVGTLLEHLNFPRLRHPKLVGKELVEELKPRRQVHRLSSLVIVGKQISCFHTDHFLSRLQRIIYEYSLQVLLYVVLRLELRCYLGLRKDIIR